MAKPDRQVQKELETNAEKFAQTIKDYSHEQLEQELRSMKVKEFVDNQRFPTAESLGPLIQQKEKTREAAFRGVDRNLAENCFKTMKIVALLKALQTQTRKQQSSIWLMQAEENRKEAQMQPRPTHPPFGSGGSSRGKDLVNAATKPNPSTQQQNKVNLAQRVVQGAKSFLGYGTNNSAGAEAPAAAAQKATRDFCDGCGQTHFDYKPTKLSDGTTKYLCPACKDNPEIINRTEMTFTCNVCGQNRPYSAQHHGHGIEICKTCYHEDMKTQQQSGQQQRRQRPRPVAGSTFHGGAIGSGPSRETMSRFDAPKLKDMATAEGVRNGEYNPPGNLQHFNQPRKRPLPLQRVGQGAAVLQPLPPPAAAAGPLPRRSQQRRNAAAVGQATLDRFQEGTEANPITLDDTDDEDEDVKKALAAADRADRTQQRRVTRTNTAAFSSSAIQLMKGMKCLMPPIGGPGAVEFTAADIARLAPDEFLNDTAIDYYLRSIRLEMEQNRPEDAERCYFFNSFFYKKLSEKKPGQRGKWEQTARDNYDKVKKWTKNVDIFSKDFIFVPIHDHLHWSLVIICHPGAVLSERKKGGRPSSAGGNRKKKAAQQQQDVINLVDSGGAGGDSQHTASQATGRSTPAEDLDPRLQPSPEGFILHLDSLSEGHSSSVPVGHIRGYLKAEWDARVNDPDTPETVVPKQWAAEHAGDEREFSSMLHVKASVPKQDNHCDCGLFVCAFVEYFAASLPRALNFAAVDKLRMQYNKDGVDLWEGSPDGGYYPGFLTEHWFPGENATKLRGTFLIKVLTDMGIAVRVLDSTGQRLTLDECDRTKLDEQQLAAWQDELENAKKFVDAEGQYTSPEDYRLPGEAAKVERAEKRKRQAELAAERKRKAAEEKARRAEEERQRKMSIYVDDSDDDSDDGDGQQQGSGYAIRKRSAKEEPHSDRQLRSGPSRYADQQRHAPKDLRDWPEDDNEDGHDQQQKFFDQNGQEPDPDFAVPIDDDDSPQQQKPPVQFQRQKKKQGGGRDLGVAAVPATQEDDNDSECMIVDETDGNGAGGGKESIDMFKIVPYPVAGSKRAAEEENDAAEGNGGGGGVRGGKQQKSRKLQRNGVQLEEHFESMDIDNNDGENAAAVAAAAGRTAQKAGTPYRGGYISEDAPDSNENDDVEILDPNLKLPPSPPSDYDDHKMVRGVITPDNLDLASYCRIDVVRSPNGDIESCTLRLMYKDGRVPPIRQVMKGPKALTAVYSDWFLLWCSKLPESCQVDLPDRLPARRDAERLRSMREKGVQQQEEQVAPTEVQEGGICGDGDGDPEVRSGGKEHNRAGKRDGDDVIVIDNSPVKPSAAGGIGGGGDADDSDLTEGESDGDSEDEGRGPTARKRRKHNNKNKRKKKPRSVLKSPVKGHGHRSQHSHEKGARTDHGKSYSNAAAAMKKAKQINKKK